MRCFGRSLLMLLILLPYGSPYGVSPSLADYREMKAEIEMYEPPFTVRETTNASPSASDTKTDTLPTRPFVDLVEKSLAEIESEKSAFFPIDEAFVEKVRPAAESAEKAETFIKGTFSPDMLEMLALLRSPAVEAAEHRMRAEIASFSQVAAVDEVLRRYTAFTEGLMVGVGPMKGADSVRMKFPFPGVTALKGQVVAQSVAAARYSLDIARRDAVTAARKLYWEMLYNRRARAITAETVELFRRLEEVADAKYRSGAASFQDVVRITVRLRVLNENLKTLGEREQNLAAEARELLNLPAGSAVGGPADRNPPSRAPSLETLIPIAREHRRELGRMRAMIDRMAWMVEMAETMIPAESSPGFSIYEDKAVMQTGSAAMQPAFPTDISAGRGAGLPPKPWFGAEAAWIDRTRRELAAKRAELAAAEAKTDRMVRDAWFMLDKARRELALYGGEVSTLSRSALDVATTGYESGEVPFADVIGAYADWLDLRLSAARKRSDLGVAWAELEKVLGKKI